MRKNRGAWWRESAGKIKPGHKKICSLCLKKHRESQEWREHIWHCTNTDVQREVWLAWDWIVLDCKFKVSTNGVSRAGICRSQAAFQFDLWDPLGTSTLPVWWETPTITTTSRCSMIPHVCNRIYEQYKYYCQEIHILQTQEEAPRRQAASEEVGQEQKLKSCRPMVCGISCHFGSVLQWLVQVKHRGRESTGICSWVHSRSQQLTSLFIKNYQPAFSASS